MFDKDKLSQYSIYYRAKHNLTQKAAAERLGISYFTIQNIEYKTGNLRSTTIAKVMIQFQADGVLEMVK